jgi:hypothetical protein
VAQNDVNGLRSAPVVRLHQQGAARRERGPEQGVCHIQGVWWCGHVVALLPLPLLMSTFHLLSSTYCFPLAPPPPSRAPPYPTPAPTHPYTLTTPTTHPHQVTKLVDLGPGDSVCSVAWSQRGTYLSVGSNSGNVQVRATCGGWVGGGGGAAGWWGTCCRMQGNPR